VNLSLGTAIRQFPFAGSITQARGPRAEIRQIGSDGLSPLGYTPAHEAKYALTQPVPVPEH
jgi:hypothetical protein